MSTPIGTPIPQDPLPTVEGRTVTSVGKHYRATYPENWEPSFNLVNTPTQKLDAYFAPQPNPNAFRSAITINCESVAADVDAQAFLNRKLAFVHQFATGNVTDPEQIAISGVTSYRVQYTQKIPTGEEVRKIDIFTTHNACGYTVSLSSTDAQATPDRAAFQGFVDSLSFQ